MALCKMAIFKVLIAIVALVSALYASTYANPITLDAQNPRVTKPVVECQLVESHTIQYIDRITTVTNNTEQVQQSPTIELHNFKDLEELRQWLVAMNTNTETFYLQPPNTTIDCDDYALTLQHKALTDGYIMSFEIISRSEYNALFATELPPSQNLHAINLTIIGNNAYYIEPQTNEIALAAHLD
jgi:hypothetical protein